MKKTKKIILSVILVLSVGAGTMANGNLPSITNVNVNNGDVLVKDVINNLQSNIQKIYNYLKGDVTINGTLTLKDKFRAGGKNLIIGDDTYLTDIDVSKTLGIYGLQDKGEAGIRLGERGQTIYGKNGKLGIGTNNPSTTLDVNGNMKVRKGLYVDNELFSRYRIGVKNGDNKHYG